MLWEPQTWDSKDSKFNMKRRNTLVIDNIAFLCFYNIKLFICVDKTVAITGANTHGLFIEAFFEFG